MHGTPARRFHLYFQHRIPLPNFLANSLKLVKYTPRVWYDKHLQSMSMTMFHFICLLLTLKTGHLFSVSSDSQNIVLNMAYKAIYYAHIDSPVTTLLIQFLNTRRFRIKLEFISVVCVLTEVIKSTRMLLHSNDISGVLKVRVGQNSVLCLLCLSQPHLFHTLPYCVYCYMS